MCGISGYLGEGDKEMLKGMCDVMSHRGPDDEGYYEDVGVGLGVRRLSVIDLEGGHQPIHNEEQTIWVIQNGEIYNYRRLMETLDEKGHRFYTSSDTETIVHAYEEYGMGFLQKLNGMFAIALWDTSKKKLILARDRIGVKPLYYTANPKEFAFASELKGILAAGRTDRRIDKTSLNQYLEYRYVPSPNTIFEDVKKLNPGHILEHSNGGFRITRYWDFVPETKIRSVCTAKTEIQKQLLDSVRLRLVSDVPVGIFLSGGLDSTILTYLAKKTGMHNPRTFSISFEDSDFDESEYSKLVADEFGTDHREFRVDYRITDTLPEIVWHLDEPFSDASAVPTYHLCKESRKYIKVALCGEGGDENFGGYRRYWDTYLLGKYRRLPSAIQKIAPRIVNMLPVSEMKYDPKRYMKKFIDNAKSDPASRYNDYMSVFNTVDRRELLNEEFVTACDTVESPVRREFAKHLDVQDIARFMYTDIKTYLPDQLLVKTDRMSMANSIEARTPFLDYNLVEMAARLDPKLKVRGLKSKWILRSTFQGKIPSKIAKRSKSGFSVPVGKWLREELDWLLDDLLERPREEYLKQKTVVRYIDAHKRRKEDFSQNLWSLVNLEIWFRVFIDSDGAKNPRKRLHEV